ncbi:MAG: class I SAM-dependent methyltransferase, partial [Acetobacteraceae bacterium]
IYDRTFYQMQAAGSVHAASVIVPMVLETLPAASVCDVGCGVGTWLNVFARCGVRDFLGLDGDYVDRGMLQIPSAQFRPTDLEKPIRLERTFDLAVCLEVGEHLPPSRAAGLVEDLGRVAAAVLFSAAIPRQGGVNHVNERWPSWWARIFSDCGFGVCDVIRPKIWDRADIVPCYRQNILIFARRGLIESNPALPESRPGQIDIAHPEFYSRLIPTGDTVLLARHLWWSINADLRKWRSARR